MAVSFVRKKDKVMVLAGKYRGKQGEVIDVDTEKSRVLVSKLNMVKRHTRATQTDAASIREKEAYMPLSKVMLVCPKCSRATRYKAGSLADGTKARVCRHCGEMIG